MEQKRIYFSMILKYFTFSGIITSVFFYLWRSALQRQFFASSMNVWHNIKQMKFNEELVCGLRRIISEPYTMFFVVFMLSNSTVIYKSGERTNIVLH